MTSEKETGRAGTKARRQAMRESLESIGFEVSWESLGPGALVYRIGRRFPDGGFREVAVTSSLSIAEMVVRAMLEVAASG